MESTDITCTSPTDGTASLPRVGIEEGADSLAVGVSDWQLEQQQSREAQGSKISSSMACAPLGIGSHSTPSTRNRSITTLPVTTPSLPPCPTKWWSRLDWRALGVPTPPSTTSSSPTPGRHTPREFRCSPRSLLPGQRTPSNSSQDRAQQPAA